MTLIGIRCHQIKTERGGFEPPVRQAAHWFSKPVTDSTSPENTNTYKGSTERASANASSSPRNQPQDPDLERVIAAWPDLPEATRAAVVAVVKAATALTLTKNHATAPGAGVSSTEG